MTSDRIADARISYNGKGVIDAANRQGWLARFFNARVLPEGAAHLARIQTGAEPLMGLTAEAF